jgi:hypothetical protein
MKTTNLEPGNAVERQNELEFLGISELLSLEVANEVRPVRDLPVAAKQGSETTNFAVRVNGNPYAGFAKGPRDLP